MKLLITLLSFILLSNCTTHTVKLGKKCTKLAGDNTYEKSIIWIVDKEYLGADNFHKASAKEKSYLPSVADQQILKDNDPNFRVFNLSVNPFTDALTSYHHKSVGGYHGAKLIRYQDMIDKHLSKQNMQVLNMLNTKYFITQDKKC